MSRNEQAMQAHMRLLITLRHRIRTHKNRFPDEHDHNRHYKRPIDRELATRVGALIEDGYSPSTIRHKLHIGYTTITRAIEIWRAMQCQP